MVIESPPLDRLTRVQVSHAAPYLDLGMLITKHSEIYAAPEGRGELGLLSVNHEQIRDMLAVANLELFLCI